MMSMVATKWNQGSQSEPFSPRAHSDRVFLDEAELVTVALTRCVESVRVCDSRSWGLFAVAIVALPTRSKRLHEC